MESDWRFNIWDAGMWGSRWRLAARYNDPDFGWGYLVEQPPFTNALFFQQLAPGLLPQFRGTVEKVPDHPHFPWGIPVEPD